MKKLLLLVAVFLIAAITLAVIDCCEEQKLPQEQPIPQENNINDLATATDGQEFIAAPPTDLERIHMKTFLRNYYKDYYKGKQNATKTVPTTFSNSPVTTPPTK